MAPEGGGSDILTTVLIRGSQEVRAEEGLMREADMEGCDSRPRRGLRPKE